MGHEPIESIRFHEKHLIAIVDEAKGHQEVQTMLSNQ